MSTCGNCGCPTGISTPTNGIDGLNAFTTTTADFVVPSVGSNVTITVSSLGQLTGKWATAGQLIFIEGAGWYRVVSSTDTTITATNPTSFTTENAALASVGSTVTLGKDVSPSGEKGASGNGSNGTNGTTVLEVDLTEYEEDQTSFSAVTKSFEIPADTWETVDDIVRLEMMLVTEYTDTTYCGVRLELDSNVLNLTFSLNDYYVSAGTLVNFTVDLVLSASGEVTPIFIAVEQQVTDYAGNYSAFNTSGMISRRGNATSGLTTSAAMDLDVTLMSSNTKDNIKLFYYKLTSLKK